MKGELKFKVGCCGFCTSMKSYFKKFEVVEVQKTFYKPPKFETVERWRKEADRINKSFEFTLKAWQIITHPTSSPTYRKVKIEEEFLKDCGFFKNSESVFKAWKIMEELAKKLKSKIVVFQTPKSFKDTEENIENIVNFFSSINNDFIFVWEPRGWSVSSIKKVCKTVNLIHCVDPFVSKPVTSELCYFRLHGCTNGKINYRHVYTDEELKKLFELLIEFESDSYVMFNNVAMCKDAERFKDLLKKYKRSKV